MAAPTTKPVLHHMNNSQSQRILWLLEELNIDYELVNHFRNAKNKLSPPEVRAVHPLGKIPVLVTATGQVISESSTIATYLLNTYDESGTFHEVDTHSDAFYVEDSLVSLSGATIGPVGVMQLFCDIVVKISPFPLSYLMGWMTSPIGKYYVTPETRKILKYLDGILGDKKWFGGAGPKKADFVLSWNFDLFVQRGWLQLEPEFPRLAAWMERRLQREAWKSSLTKGNGYDLTQF